MSGFAFQSKSQKRDKLVGTSQAGEAKREQRDKRDRISKEIQCWINLLPKNKTRNKKNYKQQASEEEKRKDADQDIFWMYRYRVAEEAS